MLQRLILAVAVTFISSSGVALAQGDAVGHWSGRAAYQSDELPIELTFESAATGLQGYFSAPTIRAYRYPLRNVSQEAGELTFELVGDASTFAFRGRLVGNSLTGSWHLFGVDADVTVARTLPAVAPYVRESATCRNGDVSLAGSIFLPSGTGPHPAVVFVHGSGAETRDASNFFADRLARAGIVAFTFDKRGAGASTGNWRDADFADLAGDVLACVSSLKARREVDARRIGLAGASQAGWVAALAASRSTDIAFMALVSGPAVPVWKEGWWDTEFRLRDGGFAAADVTKAQAILRANDEVTRTGAGFTELTRLIEAAKPEPWFRALGFQQAPPVDAPFRRFYRRIIDFDPLPILQRLSIPSLWLLGTRDGEMPAAETAAVLMQLKVEGKPVTLRTFEGADHSLFVAGTGAEFRWPRLVPGYVDAFTDWVIATALNRN